MEKEKKEYFETGEQIRSLLRKLSSLTSEREKYMRMIKVLAGKESEYRREIRQLRHEQTLPNRKELKDNWEGRRRPTGCKAPDELK